MPGNGESGKTLKPFPFVARSFSREKTSRENIFRHVRKGLVLFSLSTYVDDWRNYKAIHYITVFSTYSS